MSTQPETSRSAAHLLRGRAQAQRSASPRSGRHRRLAAAAEHSRRQGTQGATRPVVAAAARSAPSVLEARPTRQLSLSGQDGRRAAFGDHDSKSVQAGRRQGGHQEAGRYPAHAASQLGDRDARGGRRSTDDQQAAGSFQLRHDHGLSTRPPATFRPIAESARLVTGTSVSAVGGAERDDVATAEQQHAQQQPPRVIDLLRRFPPKFMKWDKVAQQVKSTLAKILLCRTAALKGRLYKCVNCDSEVNVYNSCTDRHCPQCGGARRADWLDKRRELILPGVPYFQVVFTLPSELSSLILGNRSELYNLLMQSAWLALNGELRRTGKFYPAALMVLHT